MGEDLAVAVADGATTISEIDVLRDQAELFGAVASDSTCWRLLDRLDHSALAAIAAARARVREVVRDQHAERHGRAFPSARAAGQDLDVLVIDLDASIVACHPDKELAAPTFEQTFGHHPLMAFCDDTSGFLAKMLRRGNARVEDRIRTAKDTGLNHVPSRTFAIDSAWLSVVMLAVDLVSATQHLLLHVAARITRGQRRPDPDPADLALGRAARRGVRRPPRPARPRGLNPTPVGTSSAEHPAQPQAGRSDPGN